MIGLIKGLTHAEVVRGVPRWRILISDYALIDKAKAWKGWRNPVRYASLEEPGIDIDKVSFKPMPTGTLEGARPLESLPSSVRPLTIPEAKAGLALALAISPDAIEILIKG